MTEEPKPNLNEDKDNIELWWIGMFATLLVWIASMVAATYIPTPLVIGLIYLDWLVVSSFMSLVPPLICFSIFLSIYFRKGGDREKESGVGG